MPSLSCTRLYSWQVISHGMSVCRHAASSRRCHRTNNLCLCLLCFLFAASAPCRLGAIAFAGFVIVMVFNGILGVA